MRAWAGGVLLGLLLLVLDLARPYAGPGLRPLQWAAGIALLAWLATWLRDRGQGLRQAAPVLALCAFLLPTYVDHSRNVESDGVHYYSYLRSVLFDADLDLGNDHALLGVSQSGPTVLPVGAPILWAPLVVIVHLARQAARLFGAPAPTGVEPLYQAAACLATVAYGAAALFLLQATLRRWTVPAAAFWAVVLAWIGSPLRFYLSVLPGLAHGTEFFAAVLVLRAYLGLRDRPNPLQAGWAGAACGLLFLVRSQDGILLALPGLGLLVNLLRGPERRAPALQLLALGGGFAAAALPQLVVWQLMFGVPFLVPHKLLHGAEFMHLSDPQLLGTLISPRGGLFTSHPVLLAAAVGLLLLLRRDARYVVTLAPILLAGWYVNATVFDWYHVRRFTGLVPFLAPGLGYLLAPLCRGGPLLMALLACLVLRYDLAVDGLRALPGDPAPVRAVLGEIGDGVARDGYRLLEPRAPRAAVALLAAYTGEDLLAERMSRIDFAAESAVLRLPLRARYLSAVSAEAGVACRWVTSPEMRLFLPLSWAGNVIVTLRARALETEETQAFEMSWNGSVVGRHEMAPEWADYRFSVPAGVVHVGTNVLHLQFERAPIYRRVRGTGPREMRPAALASLTLHRNE